MTRRDILGPARELLRREQEAWRRYFVASSVTSARIENDHKLWRTYLAAHHALVDFRGGA